MNAVFMGTPDIAVPCLDATWEATAGRVRVVTQPDRPRGRSGEPQPPPVKVRALELGLEVVQPERLRRDESVLAWLKREPLDVIVVVAFGQILPRDVLDIPRLGCINVHFSLLPKYRGAAPVQWAVINGETETGVDTMLMDEGLDSGPVLLSQRVPIGDGETAGELAERLQALAPDVLKATLKDLVAERLTPVPQDDSEVVLAPRLTKEHGVVDWSRPAQAISNRIRGVTPWPGAVAAVAGDELKVLRAAPGDGVGTPGSILAIDNERGLLVAAGEGAVWLREVQAPGRKPVTGAEYARGKRLSPQAST